jgi:putative DNA primase/helicase
VAPAPPQQPPLQPDYTRTVDYLERTMPRWVLTAIQPRQGRFPNKIITTTFDLAHRAEALSWLNEYGDKQWGLFYTINDIATDVTCKPKKEDIITVRCLHTDLDPKAGEDVEEFQTRTLDALRKLKHPPSRTNCSGSGIHAFWDLDEPTTNIAAAEACNKVLEKTLTGGTQTFNVDRILRLPFTVNYPDEGKIAKGRIPRLTTEIENTGVKYPLSAFSIVVPMPKPTVKPTVAKPTSRSEGDYRQFKVMLKAGKTKEEMRAYFLNPASPHGERIRERTDPEAYFEAEYQRALDKPNEFDDVLSANAPLEIARTFITECFSHPDCPTLWRHLGDYYTYSTEEGKYRLLTEEELKRKLYAWLDTKQKWGPSRQGGEPDAVPFSPNRKLVGDIEDALRGLVFLSENVHTCWLDNNPTNPAPHDVVAFKNGLVYLDPQTLEPVVRPLTPAFFSVNNLGYDFNPQASHPTEWLNFLDQTFDKDGESIQLVQEWAAYSLYGSNEQQKMLLMLGRVRGGKGTIATVLSDLIGINNVCGPTMNTLVGNFGLTSLLGKKLAVIGDAEIPHSPDAAKHVGGILKAISGNDLISVSRKFHTDVELRLPTRIVIMANPPFNLRGAASQIADRFLVLKFANSYSGREDVGLADRLHKELPGIFLWVLEGLRRLKKRGHFVQPIAAQDLVNNLRLASSPVQTFIQERCILGPDQTCTPQILYVAYLQWWQEQGVGRSLDREIDRTSETFTQILASYNVKTSRPRSIPGKPRPRDIPGKPQPRIPRTHQGIALKVEFVKDAEDGIKEQGRYS